MRFALSRHVFSLVVVAAVVAAVFRVATSPERIRARHETARQVCTSQGGEWVLVQRDYFCAPAGAASKS